MRTIAEPFVWLVRRFMPDAFIFATLLTILTFLLCLFMTEATPQGTIDAWGSGFWQLQTFTAQIAMTLMTGFALAHTPAIHSLLKYIASFAATPARAYVLVGFAACIASLISWGMGLIVGAVIARETAMSCLKRGVTVHYPLLVAAGYAGYAVWHQGLSSSIGLAIATPGHILESEIGVIPITQTLLTHYNITIALITVATLPFVMMLLKPPPSECISISSNLVDTTEEAERRYRAGLRSSAAVHEPALHHSGGLLLGHSLLHQCSDRTHPGRQVEYGRADRARYRHRLRHQSLRNHER